MAYASSSLSQENARLRKTLPLERRPRLLKDFLKDHDHLYSNSSSSNGFRSYTRKPHQSTSKNLLECGVKKPQKITSPQVLSRTKSKAASSTMSAINKASELVFTVVKYLPFISLSTVKSSSAFLPRRISCKLSKKASSRSSNKGEKENKLHDGAVKVKVKDILRWRSFRDFIEEKSEPLDPHYSPYNNDSSFTSSSNSKRSSWCGSDFTADDELLSCSCTGEKCKDDDDDEALNSLHENGVGGDSIEETRTEKLDPYAGDLTFDENNQQSPVSVLASPFQEDFYYKDLANIERRRVVLMQRIHEFENNFAEVLETLNPSTMAESRSITTCFGEIEEQENEDDVDQQAEQLLTYLRQTISTESFTSSAVNTDQVVVDHHQLFSDFFGGELMNMSRKNCERLKLEQELLREARCWLEGEFEESFEWEMEEKRKAYVRDMEKDSRWNKFEEEQEWMCKEFEVQILTDLIDELFDQNSIS